MRETGLTDSSYDAAISIFSSLGIFDDEANQEALEEFARVLRPGGRLLIDLVNRDSLMRRFQLRQWGERPDGNIQLAEHAFDERAGTSTTTWTILQANRERISRSFTV